MRDNHHCDLLIRAGRVVCPATGFDGPGSVAVRGDRIVAAGSDVDGTALRTFEFPNALLLPGLIDLHAHPDRRPFVDASLESESAGLRPPLAGRHWRSDCGSKYGIDPDAKLLPRGVTTVLSQGDAGANDWNTYRDVTIDGSRTRVRLAINLSRRGESMHGGCFENLDDVDVEACTAAIESGGDLIWGIAINVSRIACGETDPREVMRRGLEAAGQTGRPILYGVRDPGDWPFDEQMALLRAGDVVTYCFRSEPHGVVRAGRVHPAFRAARRKGVLFDVGHGMASFDFNVAEAALADSFPPDTISSDQYAKHVGSQPQHGLLRTMSKLHAAGMPVAEVLRAVTARPAEILGLTGEVGTLAAGTCADLTVLKWNEQSSPLVDVNGVSRPGGCWEPLLTVRGGQVV